MRREEDLKFMNMAFREAEKGRGTVSPNPLVGAILVKDGLVIGRGYHKMAGGDHAEVDAIKNASENLDGATLYCNLEPCCHLDKRTPPCVPLIIKSNIKRVVISNLDPNPKVSGMGVEQLRNSGIEVEVDVLKEEGLKLNEIFFHHIVNKTPFVHLKVAQTLDAKICDGSGYSKWISNEQSRKEVHQLRMNYDAVLIGRKTMNQDDPQLNIRMDVDSKGKLPFRIIWGNPLEFDWNSYLLRESTHKNIYVYESDISELSSIKKTILGKGKTINSNNVETILQELYKLGITSVLVEGGTKVLSTFLDSELFQKFTVYSAAKFLGNGNASYQSSRFSLEECPTLKVTDVALLDQNIKITMENICSQA